MQRLFKWPSGLQSTDLQPGTGSSPSRETTSTIRYPPGSTPDWTNIEVIHKNTLPPRATFYNYNNEQDAVSRDVSKSLTLCLSGTWKFKVSPYPIEPAQDFFLPNFDISDWNDIAVPGMWQLQGHGKGPQYTNMMYPWPVNPPHIPLDTNETGHYVRSFTVPKRFKDHQLRLRFEGVDSGFHVWINGHELGYSQGARNPSEFDVTDFLHEENQNTLAVRVYQRCDGTYIEDQDQWWLSGIFRDVNLIAVPKTHIKDFKIETKMVNNYHDAILSVIVKLSNPAEVQIKLLDSNFKEVKRSTKKLFGPLGDAVAEFQITIDAPQPWTAESPYLYNLVISNDTEQFIAQRVGFREVEITEGIMRVNGNPIVLRGVNRHEHHPDHGRTVPLEFLKKDLLLMKKHNINAIRTSHQPNDPRLYDLADDLGFWIMDEADLECHGMGLIVGDPASWTSDNPEWTEAYIDRAKQLVMRDKNHPCVIMWSLGNEAFYGRNHKAMYDWIKSYDSTRPVHYEGDADAKSADVFSRMYASVEYIIAFATMDQIWEKPLVLCEFAHAMGNGPGSLKEYFDAFYKYPRLQGGFVWEWANHGLRTKTAAGEEYYGYGGDFGDVPNDGHFVIDGLSFSDHTPTPGLTEYRKAIEPVQIHDDSVYNKIKITNRYDIITLDHLKCEWSIVGDGFSRPKGEHRIPEEQKPGECIELPEIGIFDLDDLPGECYVDLSFTLREPQIWAEAGFEVAFGQVLIKPPKALSTLKSLLPKKILPTVTQLSPNIIEIAGSGGSVWNIDQILGTLVSWCKGDNTTNLLTSPLILSFYRAVTDNERGNDGLEWTNARLHQTTSSTKSCTTSINESKKTVTVVVDSRIAPPVLAWSIDVTTTYTFSCSSVSIHVKGNPSGPQLPRTFARIGLAFSLDESISSASWFGRGPGESYSDTKLAQRYGNWSSTIDELYTPYEYPQESGNRTDVRWVRFNSSKKEAAAGIKASFGDLAGCSFTALHYNTEDLDSSEHTYELAKLKRKEVCARLDWRHAGIGSGSVGPKVLQEYELLCEPFEYEVLLE